MLWLKRHGLYASNSFLGNLRISQYLCAVNFKIEAMAVNSKDIETLWKQYSEESAKQGISVAQFFEANGVPYHTFEKWYILRSLLRIMQGRRG